MADKKKREMIVTRSISIDECAGGIYAIEVDGVTDFAASRLTLAAKLAEIFDLAGELAAQAAPKAKRSRKPRAPQPVLAEEPGAPEAPKRRGVTVVKSNGEVAP